jgi:hypothetical protein
MLNVFALLVFGSLDVVKIIRRFPLSCGRAFLLERLGFVMVEHHRRRDGYRAVLPFFWLRASLGELPFSNCHEFNFYFFGGSAESVKPDIPRKEQVIEG